MPRLGLTLASLLLVIVPAFAQRPASPPPPAKYEVKLRYRVPTARDLHVAAYDKLVADLKSLGFEFQPPLDELPETDREDPGKNYLQGLLPSKNLRQLLVTPWVANIQIAPEGLKLPEERDQPVRVRLELAGDMFTKEQKDLSDQTRALLELIGFREATGYDTRGLSGRPYTRLEGAVPVGTLEVLLKDLRTQLGGWFQPRFVIDELPYPLRDWNPVRLVEILDDPQPLENVKEAIPPGVSLSRLGNFSEVRVDAPTSKVSPDLWADMQDAAKKDAIVRVQVILVGSPAADDVKRMLGNAAPTFEIDGILGNTAAGLIPAGDIAALAALDRVSVVRRPHVTLPDVAPATKSPVDVKGVLAHTGVQALHDAGHRGKGVRIAVLDRDFRRWENLVGEGKLPKSTRLVDLTPEGNSAIEPLPQLAGDAAGHGALAAVAAAQGAPEADIVLIRIDPTDPYQLREIAGYLKGERLSNAMIRRFDELQLARADLIAKRRVLAAERQSLLSRFPDEAELDQEDEFSFLGPAFGWVFSERDWHRQKMAHQEKLEAALARREARYQKLIDDVRSLGGIDVLVNPYTWNQGFPLGGASPLTRWFEKHGHEGPIMLQSAGNLRGQTWTALYRDADGNGVMEFAPADVPLPKGRWSRELNFLAWEPYSVEGGRVAEIPEKTRLRLAMQWREPHEPEYFGSAGDDPYRRPLQNLRLVLLRQRDPLAKTLPADSFEVVAKSNPFPERILHEPNGSVYEHVLDATLDKAGVYAVRVERQQDHVWVIENLDNRDVRPTFELKTGLNPTGLRPAGAPALKEIEKHWEFRPRLYVEAIDPESRMVGRPVFADFATDRGTLGIPGDSRGVFTVTSTDLAQKTQPYGAVGTPAYLDLAKRQLLFVPDRVGEGAGAAFGTPLATSFTAGMAASLLSSGMPHEQVRSLLHQHQGFALRTP
jgi:hypothetical protein